LRLRLLQQGVTQQHRTEGVVGRELFDALCAAAVCVLLLKLLSAILWPLDMLWVCW
jgi:hypothetical protein